MPDRYERRARTTRIVVIIVVIGLLASFGAIAIAASSKP